MELLSPAASIEPQTIAQMTSEEVEALAKRLETDNYATPFEALQDWHLLRAVALQRPELTEDYLYLMDFEAFDEA